jgi:hypothetical protein
MSPKAMSGNSACRHSGLSALQAQSCVLFAPLGVQEAGDPLDDPKK